MKKLIASLIAVVSLAMLSASPAAAHSMQPYNTGWSCWGAGTATTVPYAPGYYLVCWNYGGQYWWMVHTH
jgi:hypothetical protein